MRLVVRYVAVLVFLGVLLTSIILMLYTVGGFNVYVAVGGGVLATTPWAVAGGIWVTKEFP